MSKTNPISKDELIGHILDIDSSLWNVKGDFCKAKLFRLPSDVDDLNPSEFLDLHFNHATIILFGTGKGYKALRPTLREVAIRNLDLLARVASNTRYRGQMAFHLYQFWLVFCTLRALGVGSQDISDKIQIVHSRLRDALNTHTVPNHVKLYNEQGANGIEFR